MRVENLYVWAIGNPARVPGVGTKEMMELAKRGAGKRFFTSRHVINKDEAYEWLYKHAGGDKDDYVRANQQEKLVDTYLKTLDQAPEGDSQLDKAQQTLFSELGLIA